MTRQPSKSPDTMSRDTGAPPSSVLLPGETDGLAGLPARWQLPAFAVRRLAPRQSRYCVLIPVLNEGDRLRRQLDRMAAVGHGCDVIIADGGSRDGATAPEELTARGVTTLLRKTGPGRLSAQLRMGMAFALAEGYDGIVAVDGNGKDGIEAIPAFTALLDQGYGFVQGSRYISGGTAEHTPLDREIGVRLVHAPLISLGAGFRYTDTTNGFRAFSAAFLRDERVQPFRDVFDTYNLHYYLSVRAPRLGYRVTETPVRRSYPPKGKTPTKIAGLAGRVHIVKQLLLAVCGAYNPPAKP